jgi:hypothetical protein
MHPGPCCSNCGTLFGAPKEYTAKLWDLHSRRVDGKQRGEPLVYMQDDLQELGFYDDEDTHDSVMLSMEKNMHERGLCPVCGLPDLRGLTDDDFYSEEDMKDLIDMWAEQAAERRAGA